MSAANPGIPEPRQLCGKTRGDSVCRLNKGHDYLTPCCFERPERQLPEYMTHGPAQRPSRVQFVAVEKKLAPDVAGRIAYEAFQKRACAVLSAEVKQNATTKKPVPTGARATWEMLNESTRETWVVVAQAILEAHGCL